MTTLPLIPLFILGSLAVQPQASAQDFPSPTLAVDNFGFNAGGWRISQHPRHLGDVNGDGRDDIVGFGNAGTFVSLGLSNGLFANPVLAVNNFGVNAGGWRLNQHVRLLGDVNGDGRDDIVGFGNAGTFVSLGQANGRFANPVLAVDNFGFNAGGWRVSEHPRLLGDVNGDGRADIVGFGNAGAFVSLGQANGQFSAPLLAVDNFGFNAGGWRVSEHPRLLGDVNGDGRDDIVGFGNAGAFVSLGQANGQFSAPVLAVDSFGVNAGGWRVTQHVRLLGDVNGDGLDDLVGFGNAGTFVSLAGAPTVHNLYVRRFVNTTLTNDDTDRILNDATTLLQISDGPDDVACNIVMARGQGVDAFNVGGGVVRDSAGFNTLVALPGDVKIVNAINWCGGPGTGIIGCAPTPGGSFAAVRFAADREGILWAHEFAHNQGRPHRDGANFVMNPFITATARRVDTAECNAFRNPTPAMDLFALARMEADSSGDHQMAMLASDEVAVILAASPSSEEEGIEAVVRRHYVAGLPYDQVSRFGEEVLPQLFDMLANPEEKPFWPNIVGAIGIIGGEGAVETLTAFIDDAKGDALDIETYRASLDAFVALGYLANRDGDAQALGYLTDTAEDLPEVSAAAAADSTGELRLSPVDLTQSAVLGLAISGRPEAREVLQGLRAANVEAATDEAVLLNDPTDNLIAEALETNEKVNEQGLSQYYRHD